MTNADAQTFSGAPLTLARRRRDSAAVSCGQILTSISSRVDKRVRLGAAGEN
jgi:hypothetical protein